MAKIENDASLRGKIRAVASKSGLRAQEVLQMYLFEHLLLRLERSSYSNIFVLKGREHRFQYGDRSVIGTWKAHLRQIKPELNRKPP